ncbi:hypothetical protein ACIBO2_20610 [Nonomuraea sp. NPDC050022]|uniref:hypothetical protein n=1 Tax=Nonomuraea sp. NPDC050022 TaxID=3364358 RepID=UPI0037A0508E
MRQPRRSTRPRSRAARSAVAAMSDVLVMVVVGGGVGVRAADHRAQVVEGRHARPGGQVAVGDPPLDIRLPTAPGWRPVGGWDIGSRSSS